MTLGGASSGSVKVRCMTNDSAVPATEATVPDGGAGLMTGFPPSPRSRVTLANWQDPPFNRWAFRHMREIIPTQPIPAGPAGAAPLAASGRDLGDPPVVRLNGRTAAV